MIGERWDVGGALLEVSQPQIPATSSASAWATTASPRFAAAGRPGAYLRLLHEGVVTAGDQVRIVSRPHHGVTVGRRSRVPR
ncbi:MAG: MOSC domain-containing protein [Egibacteraceae bacterium]